MLTAIERLARCPRFGSGLGFVRCEALLDRLGLDPEGQRTIGITGSNGKGSTSAMTSALLTGVGLRVGLYTSPHFLDPCERFRIDGVSIQPEVFEELAAVVLDAAESIAGQLGETFARFELLTVMAWRLFQRERVDIAVLEAGIGGRFDTTRLAKPTITAITSLDLEHRELLGDSLELIFADKLELTRAGGVCFASLPSDGHLRSRCRALAKLSTVQLNLLDEILPDLKYEESPTGAWFTLDRSLAPIRLPVLGEWQGRNAALAISIAREAVATPPDLVGWAERSLSVVTIPGRFETVQEDPRIVVDAAHTPDAIQQVVAQILRRSAADLPLYPTPIVLVGISANKPVEQMATMIAKLRAPLFVAASSHGGAEPELLAAMLRAGGAEIVAVSSDLGQTLSQARACAERLGGTLFVLGGLFFAADVCRLLRGEAPEGAIYL